MKVIHIILIVSVFVYLLIWFLFFIGHKSAIGFYYIFGVFATIFSLVCCIVEQSLLADIEGQEYYEFDQNWHLQGLDKYWSCSSPGFNESIKKATTPMMET